MPRVVTIDMPECRACGGRIRILTAIHDLRAIPECVGLPACPSPVSPPARDPKFRPRSRPPDRGRRTGARAVCTIDETALLTGAHGALPG